MFKLDLLAFPLSLHLTSSLRSIRRWWVRHVETHGMLLVAFLCRTIARASLENRQSNAPARRKDTGQK